MENKKDVQKRLITFVFFTYGISSIFIYWAITSGSLRTGGGLAALGGMWSPGIAALLRGIVWSVWHYPLIIFGIYGSKDLPIWYKLICFTVLLTGVSFAFTWFRLKSGSLWTGMFLHASHNLFVQGLPGLTTDKGMTAYFIDEFGAVSAVVAVVVAFIFWKKSRKEVKT